jgi:hypothetical protein
VGYTDFGNTNVSPPEGYILGSFSAQTKQYAATLFGVGYLPLPHQWDLYAKLGAARLRTEDRSSTLPPSCGAGAGCYPYLTSQDAWSTDLAYGVGAHRRFGPFSIRAEYERIQATGGSPNLLSVGAAWKFL